MTPNQQQLTDLMARHGLSRADVANLPNNPGARWEKKTVDSWFYTGNDVPPRALRLIMLELNHQ